MDDGALRSFLQKINQMLRPGGYIMIQGKTARSQDIARSTEIGVNLMKDHDDHIRRLWDEQTIRELMAEIGSEILDLGVDTEIWNGQEKEFIHVIAQKRLC